MNIFSLRSVFAGLSLGGLFVFLFGTYPLGVWYGMKLLRKTASSYSSGDVMTVFFSVNQGAMPLGSLAPIFKAFAEAKAALGRIIPLMNRKPKINIEDDSGEKKGELLGRVEFKKVCFTYPSRDEALVLNNIDLVINQGEKVALVGESGCGKTTCTYLIERLNKFFLIFIQIFYLINKGFMILIKEKF